MVTCIMTRQMSRMWQSISHVERVPSSMQVNPYFMFTQAYTVYWDLLAMIKFGRIVKFYN